MLVCIRPTYASVMQLYASVHLHINYQCYTNCYTYLSLHRYLLHIACSESDYELENLRQVLDELDIFQYNLTDCIIMKRICEVVSTRAAYLSAAGISFIQ